MARGARLPLILVSALALVLGIAPSAEAATSTTTFTLTLRGTVPAGIGFELSLSPGVGASNVFCVRAGDPLFPEGPRCTSGRTYTTVVELGAGDSIGYDLDLVRPRSAHSIWSGTLTGDGRHHRRSYVFDFDLPATDAVASTPPSAHPASDGPRAPLPVVALAAVLGWSAWSFASRRRGRLGRS